MIPTSFPQAFKQAAAIGPILEELSPGITVSLNSLQQKLIANSYVFPPEERAFLLTTQQEMMTLFTGLNGKYDLASHPDIGIPAIMLLSSLATLMEEVDATPQPIVGEEILTVENNKAKMLAGIKLVREVFLQLRKSFYPEEADFIEQNFEEVFAATEELLNNSHFSVKIPYRVEVETNVLLTKFTPTPEYTAALNRINETIATLTQDANKQGQKAFAKKNSRLLSLVSLYLDAFYEAFASQRIRDFFSYHFSVVQDNLEKKIKSILSNLATHQRLDSALVQDIISSQDPEMLELLQSFLIIVLYKINDRIPKTALGNKQLILSLIERAIVGRDGVNFPEDIQENLYQLINSAQDKYWIIEGWDKMALNPVADTLVSEYYDAIFTNHRIDPIFAKVMRELVMPEPEPSNGESSKAGELRGSNQSSLAGFFMPYLSQRSPRHLLWVAYTLDNVDLFEKIVNKFPESAAVLSSSQVDVMLNSTHENWRNLWQKITLFHPLALFHAAIKGHNQHITDLLAVPQSVTPFSVEAGKMHILLSEINRATVTTDLVRLQIYNTLYADYSKMLLAGLHFINAMEMQISRMNQMGTSTAWNITMLATLYNAIVFTMVGIALFMFAAMFGKLISPKISNFVAYESAHHKLEFIQALSSFMDSLNNEHDKYLIEFMRGFSQKLQRLQPSASLDGFHDVWRYYNTEEHKLVTDLFASLTLVGKHPEIVNTIQTTAATTTLQTSSWPRCGQVDIGEVVTENTNLLSSTAETRKYITY